jgi:type VII secretion-associated serine protease mycosin
VWQLTEGQGVTAAIVDSGAQRDHPMLSGRIADYVDLTGTGDKDCDGHGTGVASILGGKDLTAQGVPFTGVAPAVRLVVVKAQVGRDDANGAGRLAQGIRTAVDKGAKVVNVSVRASDTPPLRAAVQYAQSKGVLIVAAAGNTGDEQNGQPSYPAQYPGVLSVGALASDGSKGQDSGLTTRVDLSAPGENVETAWVGSGYNLQASGTSFAAPYVAGVAALVMSYHPSLTWQQVILRLVATADGSAGDGTGAGMVDPVQAVTAVLPSEGSSAAIVSHSPVPVSLATPHPSDDRAETVAFAVSGGALLVGCCVLIAGVSLPMGRRREWRPGRPVIPEDDSGANGD